MHLVRRHRGGGVVFQAETIIGLAVRQPPDAAVMGGAWTHGLQGVGLTLDGRIDLIGQDGLGLGGPVAGQVLLGRAARQGGGHDRVGCGRAGDGAHLGQGAIDDEVRRHGPGGELGLHPRPLVVHALGEVRQARQIGLGVVRRLDTVLTVEEVGDLLIGAAQLTDGVGRGREAAAVGEAVPHHQGVAEELQRVVIGLLGRRQLTLVDGLHGGHAVLELDLVGVDPGLRAVAQLEAGVSHRSPVHAQHGQGLGIGQDHLLGDLVQQGQELGRGGTSSRRRGGLRPNTLSQGAGGARGRERASQGSGHQQAATVHHRGFLPKAMGGDTIEATSPRKASRSPRG
ncbi:hypothetical protein D3C72_1008330 [compost metagenome]